MSGKLFDAIESRKDGTPYDVSLLNRTMDAIVVRIHMKRYPFAWERRPATPEPDEGRLVVMRKDPKGEKRWWCVPKESEQLLGGIVEIEEFRVSCWERLSDKGVQRKIIELTPGEDPQVIKFLDTTFKRLLQEKIYELTPGLETRVKQVNRVLKDECMEEDRKKGIWKLKNLSIDPDTPSALLEDLRFAGRERTPPVLHHSGNLDSDRGPSIPDREMKEYLASLLTAVGGTTRRTTLIEYLKEIYGLDPPRRVYPASNPDGREGPDPIDTINSSDEAFLGQEQLEMAETIIGGMTLRWKMVYYHHIVSNQTLAETAAIIGGIGTTTAHNEMIKITKHAKKTFSRYACDDPEEAAAVMDLVGAMIKKEMETHGPNR